MKQNQFDFPDRKKQAQLHAKVLEEVRSMTPEEGFKDLIKSGIYTSEGKLAPEYGGPPRTRGKKKKK